MAATRKSTTKKTSSKASASSTASAKVPPRKSRPKKAAATGKPAAKKTTVRSTTKKASVPTKTSAGNANTESTQKADGTETPYPFSKAFLRQQRAALLAERERYARHAEGLKAEADQLARDREPGDVQFDEESGEGDGIAVERERDLALSAQASDAVDQIDAALARLDAGTYGLSVVSGLAIPEERLEAIAHADMRVDEKTRGMTWT